MLKTSLLALALPAFFSVMVFAQGRPEVTVNLRISPAGSFQATTSAVKGPVKVTGNDVTAGPIIVELRTLQTGIKLRDDHMKNKYLDIKTYPTAELTLGQGSAGKGKGKLKIKGVEKEVSGIYKVSGKKIEAKFEFNLSDFNISGIRYMGAGVKDKAEVSVVLPIQ